MKFPTGGKAREPEGAEPVKVRRRQLKSGWEKASLKSQGFLPWLFLFRGREMKERFMRRALDLAKKGLGRTSPNPMVGAVVVNNGQIVGEGYHRKAGLPHAEVEALDKAGIQARSAELYITLEPCCFQGRTPPCTEAIIKAGLRKVYVGTIDPNPKVNGRGVKILQAHGIEVEVGFFEKELKELNEAYFKHITTGFPFVIIKNALSLNGKIGFKQEKTQLSQEKAQRFVHRLRASVDAIMVGINTVLNDDPLLTPRHSGLRLSGKRWIRVVLDSKGRIPLDSCLVSTAKEVETWLATTSDISKGKVRSLEEAGLRVEFFPRGRNGMVSLVEVLRKLGKEGIISLLVEGGSCLNSSFLASNFWDKAVFILTPHLLIGNSLVDLVKTSNGNSSKKLRLKLHRVKKLGEDLALIFYPEREEDVYRVN